MKTSNYLNCLMVSGLLFGCTSGNGSGGKEPQLQLSSASSSFIVDSSSTSSASNSSFSSAAEIAVDASILKLYALTEPVQTANGLIQVSGEKLEAHLKTGLRKGLSNCSDKKTLEEITFCYSSVRSSPSSRSISSSSSASIISPYEKNYAAELLGADNYLLHKEYWSIGREGDSGNISVELHGVEPQSFQTLDLGFVGNLALYSVAGVTDGTTSVALSFKNKDIESNALFERRFKPNDQIRIRGVGFDQELGGKNNWSIDMSGTLLKAHLSGDVLYIVSQYSAQLPDVKYDFSDFNVLQNNESIIADGGIQNLLPSYSVDGQPIAMNESCYEQHGLTESDFLSSPLTYITSVNLRTKAFINATCINAPIDSLIVNDDGILLLDHWRDDLGVKTIAHYFSINNGLSTYEMTSKLLGHVQPKSMLSGENEIVLINGLELRRLHISDGSVTEEKLPWSDLFGNVSTFHIENEFVVATTDRNEIFTLSRQNGNYAIVASNNDLKGARGNVWRVSEALYLMAASMGNGGLKLVTFFVGSNNIQKLDEYVYEGVGFFSEAFFNRFSVNIDPELGYVSIPFMQDWRDHEGHRGLIFYKFNSDDGKLPRLVPVGVQLVSGNDYRADFSESGVVVFKDGQLKLIDWSEFDNQGAKDLELGLRCNNSGIGYARYRHTFSSHFCRATNARENIDTGEIKTFYGGSLGGGLGEAHYCDYSVPIDEPGNYIIHWGINSSDFGPFDREYLISEYGCPSPIE